MIKCIDYKAINKGNCLGIVDIFVEKWGVELYGFTLHQKDGRRWINVPQRPYKDKETGETKYANTMRFPNKEHYNKFLQLVKDAVDADAKAESNQAEEEVPF